MFYTSDKLIIYVSIFLVVVFVILARKSRNQSFGSKPAAWFKFIVVLIGIGVLGVEVMRKNSITGIFVLIASAGVLYYLYDQTIRTPDDDGRKEE
jgi:hypothetical protein